LKIHDKGRISGLNHSWATQSPAQFSTNLGSTIEGKTTENFCTEQCKSLAAGQLLDAVKKNP
jgi:hypothetical protein